MFEEESLPRRAGHRHRRLRRGHGQLRRAPAHRVQGLVGRHGRSLRDQVAIVGIGQTAFGKGLAPTASCRSRARRSRWRSTTARSPPAEVDGLASFTMELNREVDVARNVGLGDITYFSQVGYGGGAGCGGARRPRWRSRPGSAESRSAWRARKRAAKASRPWAQVARRLDDHWQWSRPFGLLRPVDEVAMLARRYMHEYGGTRDHLANVRAGVPQARQPQPGGDDVRQAADPRAVHGRPLDLRAAVPLRQLPRDRRGARRGARRAPSGPGTCRSGRCTCTRRAGPARASTRR